MKGERRAFIRIAAAAGAYGLSRSLAPAWAAGDPPANDASGKRLLILGGTAFLGPQVVEAARKRGYTITLFNRGKTRPELFPDLEKLRGDRDGNLKALEGRTWDAVVDTSGFVPRHVRDSATLLANAVKLYVFISTVSVYSDPSKPGMDETSPVEVLPDESLEKVDGETYGPLKAACESAAEKAMPGRVAVIRPGLIVGPEDSSDRFTYWPVRISRGGDVLAPGTVNDPVQFIDVRDLAEWTMRVVDEKTVGIYNAIGPEKKLHMGVFLETCKRVSVSGAKFVWVNTAFLEAQKVAPWADMPVWVSPTGASAGFARVSNARAIAKGLKFRPLNATVRDTLAWWKTQPKERQEKLRAGIKPEREAEVIAAWKQRKVAPAVS